ncbi:beta-1,3-N-acetylglucosaminyltransferase manic fringe-like [Physella acuta]|uniref:beta-1,3-N-acetylglucosaminyltransferase manic fringe-like n=1 Tax=Physella acuta TaxID=109671 RepID=UPI0027DBAC75|nr:beta-1,3-N-acetylglucosaminyltransferase manic fringe-like [Physella acuta]
MRLSLRKVVKYATFLIFFMVLNIWISYNVNIWRFDNFEDRGKVLQNLRRGRSEDNGGAAPLPAVTKSEGIHRKLDPDVLPLQKEDSAVLLSNKAFRFRQKQTLSYDETRVVLRSKSQESDNNLLLSDSNRFRIGVGKDAADTNISTHVQTETISKQSRDIKSFNTQTELNDIFISVKTTAKYHQSRLDLLLKTWYLLAREQIYFFTDANDKEMESTLGEHLINTNCSTDHSRRALSCKMAVEFDYYLASRKRWFCHMDDDVYLNVPRLVEMLKKYNYKEDWYLGKPSLKHPLEVVDRDNPGMKLTFWFATGGAGFCISRSLALKMAPYAGGGRFVTTAEKVRLPDDCTVGYIIEYLLKHKLTVVEEFHSHLEALWPIKPSQLKKQITLSFSEYSGKQNVINIQGFSEVDDPTRLKSLHCFLFPTFRECRGLP